MAHVIVCCVPPLIEVRFKAFFWVGGGDVERDSAFVHLGSYLVALGQYQKDAWPSTVLGIPFGCSRAQTEVIRPGSRKLHFSAPRLHKGLETLMLKLRPVVDEKFERKVED